MARGIRVRINGADARALLASPPMQSDVMARAEAIAASACAKTSPDRMRNEPFMAADDSASTRARARAFAATPHGIRSQNKRNTLLKSIDAGR